ncbi:hypothetical protein F383_17632 [Gossypium arboreum]|uniref:Uncharacterized protein n=1 Tax=Gossypium arboreum TaxID=29729 RepID=A0A0B0NSS5_GOSAR|nr:hypothetical protein F383_17632 [Gossypium arboreum]
MKFCLNEVNLKLYR